jgi:hypothetical protein
MVLSTYDAILTCEGRKVEALHVVISKYRKIFDVENTFENKVSVAS